MDSINRAKCDQQEHKERALEIAQEFVDSLDKAVMAEPEPPTIPISQPKDSMTIRHTIADVEIGSNVIKIDVTAQDDGGLKIFDWSMGSVADEMFGDDRDVEHWIDITPAATRELSVKLFRDWVDDPADEVARHLATRYLGDTKALHNIRTLLDELDVPYKRHMWP